MNNSNQEISLSRKLLITMRALLTMTVAWDFLLTVGFHSSQRALVLTGIATVFFPYVFAIWITCILGLACVLIYTFFGNINHEQKSAKIAYVLSILLLGLYIFLFALAISNPIVAWPVILNYMVNIIWISTIIYFRKEYTRIYNL